MSEDLTEEYDAAVLLAKKDTRIAELEAALKPFADLITICCYENSDEPDDANAYSAYPTFGDLRAARAAYLGEDK